MFHFNRIDPAEVARFETPYHYNSVEVCLDDRSVNPTGDPDWTPVHCVMPERYCQFADRIRNLTVYEDDVWIVTFPKAGTTWTQEMVWLIAHDLDYETASRVHLSDRSIFLEPFAFTAGLPIPDTISQVENTARPRHIKSHLPLALLPKQLWTVRPKIVYTARNPRDVATSYMHHYLALHGFEGSQQDFLDGILADRIIWCPQVKHAVEFWRTSRNRPDHVLFLHYEDMKRNLEQIVQKVAEFFGKTLSSEQIERLRKHLSFEVMKDNKFANNQQLVTFITEVMGRKSTDFIFMRKGEVGSHKNQLPEDYVEKFEQFVESELKGTGFKYRE